VHDLLKSRTNSSFVAMICIFLSACHMQGSVPICIYENTTTITQDYTEKFNTIKTIFIHFSSCFSSCTCSTL